VVSFDVLEGRQLLATIVRDLPEFNGQEFRDSTTQFPRSPVQVSTLSVGQELRDSTIRSATISGTFGNSTVRHSAGVSLFLDGIQVAQSVSFNRPPPRAWSHTFSGAELAALQDGVVELTAVQTSLGAIRLGQTHLKIDTSARNTVKIPFRGPGRTDSTPRPPADGRNGDPGGKRQEALDLGAITQSRRVRDAISSLNDIDFYKFKAEAGQIITFDIDANGLDSFIKFFSGDLKELQTISPFGNNNSESEESEEQPSTDKKRVTLDSFARFIAPTSGTFYIAVSNNRHASAYNPDKPEPAAGETRPQDTGRYTLTIRTPNIRIVSAEVGLSSISPRKNTLRVTYEVLETNLVAGSRPIPLFIATYAGNELDNSRRDYRVPEQDTLGRSPNLIGRHTVELEVEQEPFSLIQIDPPGRVVVSEQDPSHGAIVESNEDDNFFLVSSEDCGPSTATIARPEPRTWSYFDWKRPTANPNDIWSMNVEVSQNEGLVLSNVRLGQRLMAKKMSIPYFTLQVNGTSSQRGELTPDSDRGRVRTRLVDYQIGIRDEDFTGQNDIGDPLVIKAVYTVDRIGRRSVNSACLTITQEYKFYQADPNKKCFAGQNLSILNPPANCAEFKPIVSYAFHTQGGDTLSSVTIPQRFNFQVETPTGNSAGVFRDYNSYAEGLLHFGELPKLRNENPLTRESRFTAIDRGQPGSWDNYHQTNERSIEEPSGLNASPLFLDFPPGCLECTHVHWRWGENLDFPPGSHGRPIIPAGSNQTVDVGIALARGTDKPRRWENTINGERINGQDIVFWYAGTGFRPTDSFFTHGGFFYNFNVNPPIFA
jgi:hypothetical protein